MEKRGLVDFDHPLQAKKSFEEHSSADYLEGAIDNSAEYVGKNNEYNKNYQDQDSKNYFNSSIITPIYRKIDLSIDRKINRQIEKQIDRQKYRQMNRQTDR